MVEECWNYDETVVESLDVASNMRWTCRGTAVELSWNCGETFWTIMKMWWSCGGRVLEL